MKLPVVTAIPAKFSVFYDLNHVDLYTCLSTFWWKFLLLHRTYFCPEKKAAKDFGKVASFRKCHIPEGSHFHGLGIFLSNEGNACLHDCVIR